MLNKPFYCFDMDGTLASTKDRAHLKGNDWETYHSLAATSEPIKPLCSMLRDLAFIRPVVINTARDERYKEATIDWLQTNGMSALTEVLMGKEGVDVHAQKVANMFTLCKWPQILCLAWFDDDPLMVEVGRAAGFNMVLVQE